MELLLAIAGWLLGMWVFSVVALPLFYGIPKSLAGFSRGSLTVKPALLYSAIFLFWSGFFLIGFLLIAHFFPTIAEDPRNRIGLSIGLVGGFCLLALRAIFSGSSHEEIRADFDAFVSSHSTEGEDDELISKIDLITTFAEMMERVEPEIESIDRLPATKEEIKKALVWLIRVAGKHDELPPRLQEFFAPSQVRSGKVAFCYLAKYQPEEVRQRFAACSFEEQRKMIAQWRIDTNSDYYQRTREELPRDVMDSVFKGITVGAWASHQIDEQPPPKENAEIEMRVLVEPSLYEGDAYRIVGPPEGEGGVVRVERWDPATAGWVPAPAMTASSVVAAPGITEARARALGMDPPES